MLPSNYLLHFLYLVLKRSYIYLKKSCRNPVWQIYVDTVYIGWEYLTYDMQGTCTKHTRHVIKVNNNEKWKLKTWLSCYKTCTFSIVIVSQGEADRWSELSISEHACQAHFGAPTQSNQCQKRYKMIMILKIFVLELKNVPTYLHNQLLSDLNG